MITCNRCGNGNPVNAVMCQRCGTPLANRVENESSQRRAGREQQELPAWLESLRASDPPTPSVNDSPNFHAADFADEGSLPNWMRPQRDAADNPPSSPYPALHASSTPVPNTDEGAFAAKGIPARSLMDEQVLPQWLQQDKQAAVPQRGIDASSLVQPDAMPEWMKTMQPQAPAHPASPATQAEAPPSGFSAGDLIDQSSLPAWMSQQGGQETANPAKSGQGGAPGQGFSASSLLDMNSLPRWLRDIDKGQQGGSMLQQNAPFPPPQTNQPWQAPPQEGFPPPTQSNQSWQVAPGYQEGQRAAYGVPSRAESMRVPNRPRTEVGSNEGNEAAANVFASMLGVASAAPHFPAPPPGMQAPQMSPAGYAPTQQAPRPQMGMNSAQPGQASPQGFQPQQPLQAPYGPGYNSGYLGSPQGSMPQQAVNNSSVGVPMQGGPGGQKPATKKRGFFEFFRSWFSRQ